MGQEVDGEVCHPLSALLKQIYAPYQKIKHLPACLNLPYALKNQLAHKERYATLYYGRPYGEQFPYRPHLLYYRHTIASLYHLRLHNGEFMHPRPVVAVAAYTTQKERDAPLFSGIDLQDKGLVAILYGI